jgi:hypothetical protein
MIDIFQVLFDDELAVQYEHLANPITAKQLVFWSYGNTIIDIYNITYITN